MRTIDPLVLAVLAILLFNSAASNAATTQPAVVDHAGFFSADAVADANRKLADLHEKTGRTLRIETFERMPSELQVQAADHRELMRQWARDRAKETGLSKGVFVLISREPSSLHAEVLGSAVSRADHQRLVNALLGGFKAKEYDQALADAATTFAKSASAQQDAGDAAAGSTPNPYRLPDSPAPAPSASERTGTRGPNWGSLLLWAVLIVGGIWLLRKLFGGRREQPYPRGYGANRPGNDPAGNYPPEHDPRYGGGGGAFGRGVGGGLLGGLLGSWIGHQVFRGHDNPANAAPPPTDPGATSDPQQADAGNDFGGGGDFDGGDDFGGGGDF